MQTTYPISKTQAALLAEKNARLSMAQADLTGTVAVILAGHDVTGAWQAVNFGDTENGPVLTIETPDPAPNAESIPVDQGEGPEA